ncbi:MULTISPECIES: ferritin [Petrimonas]|jgi:ferritin|uniref:Ferritin n=1 Tax=Petrimonas mucosa TaxID=1642646 RepID=A0A1G4G4I5_9BACT|nr:MULTISPECIES: ferritin [Petrimonas]SCM55679.1 Bacterial non-heme ferritin [Petrimonas mucosa]SFU68718.1 ferritin [Porphyromonadaceae bacterium KHP3R9]HHT30227.1 ferritin [Petrimonas mucosa]
MVSKKLEDAINAQINAEFWSAYLYLSMSAHFANQGLMGFSNWFKVQFQEEQDHAQKFMNYLISKGNKVELKPIEKVETSWESILKAFEDTLAHERVVTGLINNLVSIARSENDYATENMLQWFVNEQVEEEETAQGMIDSLKLIGTNGFGIYTMDKELAQRTYTPLGTGTTAE